MKQISLSSSKKLIFLFFRLLIIAYPGLIYAENSDFDIIHKETVQKLSRINDRSTGTLGSRKASEHIKSVFHSLGFSEIGSHMFSLPMRTNRYNKILIEDATLSISLNPTILNTITPDTTGPEGIEGSLIYVGKGTLPEFNGKEVEDAIVLMDLDSDSNWMNAANLSAKALIYLDKKNSNRFDFSQKYELSPLKFPRFWVSIEDSLKLKELLKRNTSSQKIKLISDVKWENKIEENIYCMVEGIDPKLKEEIIWVEAFYDSSQFVMNKSPGADESLSIASLLSLAAYLKTNPPNRSILLVATSGHAQSLSGMRELIWSVTNRANSIRNEKRFLSETISKMKSCSTLVSDLSRSEHSLKLSSELKTNEGKAKLLKDALSDDIKNKVEEISSELTELRFKDNHNFNDKIQHLAKLRLSFRQLGWKPSFNHLTDKEILLVKELLPYSVKRYERILHDLKEQLLIVESATKFRSLLSTKETSAIISLHLSSHGSGIGAFNQGFLFPLKSMINRTTPYSLLDQKIREITTDIEKRSGLTGYYKDTLRPSTKQLWESYFLDQPALGGEIGSLAGFLGVTLVTVNDARYLWGTPRDHFDTINWKEATVQNRYVIELVHKLSKVLQLKTQEIPRKGLAAISGKANCLRQGELFPDQPASESIILSFQGPGIYHSRVDTLGRFELRGIADKRHLLHKVIIEGYRFDPKEGNIIWAIDKPKTGKDSYRVKMNRMNMTTDLVMFPCNQSTMFNLLEPRTFEYMTKLQLIDSRTDSSPSRYWYSRIDTRKSILSSFFLDKGTKLKLTLSDTLLENKMILSNGNRENPYGIGYSLEEWPFISPTEYLVAKDMWNLLTPRLDLLENRGIYNSRLRSLQTEGIEALQNAEHSKYDKKYDSFLEWSRKSWALAIKVYKDVNKTQKDIILGVLFYVALFIPFSFSMERLLFSFQNIYKRLSAFIVILSVLTGIIYSVHPAFRIVYNPLVVIWAFFITMLSLLVIVIIFMRFEEEMLMLKRRTKSMIAQETNVSKAFSASFFLGVSNLRRRRLRTGLTAATLIILTFTVMNFTSVKTIRRHSRILYQDSSYYNGILLKEMGWKTLPSESAQILRNIFNRKEIISERGWIETKNNIHQRIVPVRIKNIEYDARGIMGISHTEPIISGIDKVIVQGRWFNEEDENTLIISDHMARLFGISEASHPSHSLSIWGIPFKLIGIFSSQELDKIIDLDGEPLTPVTFPGEIHQETTEVEMDAMESGEDIISFQSKYEHVPSELTVFVPFKTMIKLGGSFKSAAISTHNENDLQNYVKRLVDRIGLTVFSGEKNRTYMYSASNRINYGGIPNILIPFFISIGIVLNTMINSVYERKGEIGVYTSVGLAPSHVSFLFIAEALSFAIISVVIGYLVAQSSANFFGDTEFFKGMTINYSSLSAVLSMILIIIVVLLSSFYPSKVAANLSMPDVKKNWSLIKSDRSNLYLTFPFLLKENEVRNAASFLYNYFKSHEDISHGDFSSGNITEEMFHSYSHYREIDSKEFYRLRAKVWMAPFDFGIMQNITLSMHSSEEENGFIEIRLNLKRKSGEISVWNRVNKEFVYKLRKQLLIWRSLPDSEKEKIENQA